MAKKKVTRKKAEVVLNDVSPRAVLAMLLIVIVVSALSLVLYLEALDKVKPEIVLNGGKVWGEVSLTPFPAGGAQSKPKAQGEVYLTLVEPPKE